MSEEHNPEIPATQPVDPARWIIIARYKGRVVAVFKSRRRARAEEVRNALRTKFKKIKRARFDVVKLVRGTSNAWLQLEAELEAILSITTKEVEAPEVPKAPLVQLVKRPKISRPA